MLAVSYFAWLCVAVLVSRVVRWFFGGSFYACPFCCALPSRCVSFHDSNTIAARFAFLVPLFGQFALYHPPARPQLHTVATTTATPARCLSSEQGHSLCIDHAVKPSPSSNSSPAPSTSSNQCVRVVVHLRFRHARHPAEPTAVPSTTKRNRL